MYFLEVDSIEQNWPWTISILLWTRNNKTFKIVKSFAKNIEPNRRGGNRNTWIVGVEIQPIRRASIFVERVSKNYSRLDVIKLFWRSLSIIVKHSDWLAMWPAITNQSVLFQHAPLNFVDAIRCPTNCFYV